MAADFEQGSHEVCRAATEGNDEASRTCTTFEHNLIVVHIYVYINFQLALKSFPCILLCLFPQMVRVLQINAQRLRNAEAKQQTGRPYTPGVQR